MFIADFKLNVVYFAAQHDVRTRVKKVIGVEIGFLYFRNFIPPVKMRRYGFKGEINAEAILLYKIVVHTLLPLTNFARQVQGRWTII